MSRPSGKGADESVESVRGSAGAKPDAVDTVDTLRVTVASIEERLLLDAARRTV